MGESSVLRFSSVTSVMASSGKASNQKPGPGPGTWLLDPAKKGQSGSPRAQPRGCFPPTVKSCLQKVFLVPQSFVLRQDRSVEGMGFPRLSWTSLRGAGGVGGSQEGTETKRRGQGET